MEEKHAIEVTDLVISYQNLKKTSIKKNLLHFNRQKADRFVAVKGISFYVREGEILGIIGKNGCGKSTTLNALAGIFHLTAVRLTFMDTVFLFCLSASVSSAR